MTEIEKIKAQIAYYNRNLGLLRVARKGQSDFPTRGAYLAIIQPTSIANGVPCEKVGIPAECIEEILRIAEEKTIELLDKVKLQTA